MRLRLRYCVCGHDFSQHLWPDEAADYTGNPGYREMELRKCRLCICPAYTPAKSPSDVRLAREVVLPKLEAKYIGLT